MKRGKGKGGKSVFLQEGGKKAEGPQSQGIEKRKSVISLETATGERVAVHAKSNVFPQRKKREEAETKNL